MAFPTRRLPWVLLPCAVLLVCAVACRAAECALASSAKECTEMGCDIVTGTSCASGVRPPCSRVDDKCCEEGGGNSDHLRFIGCMDKGYICYNQCIRNRESKEMFLVWDGCAFDSDLWEDRSSADACYSCHRRVCPMTHQDNNWLYYGLIMVVLCLVIAGCVSLVLLFILIASRTPELVAWWRGVPGYAAAGPHRYARVPLHRDEGAQGETKGRSTRARPAQALAAHAQAGRTEADAEVERARGSEEAAEATPADEGVASRGGGRGDGEEEVVGGAAAPAMASEQEEEETCGDGRHAQTPALKYDPDHTPTEEAACDM